MKRRQLKADEVLQFWAKNYKLENKKLLFELGDLWLELMGKDIYNKTSKIQIKNKTLEIYINSPILKNELQYTKTKILKKIQDKMGENNIINLKIL